MDKKIKGLWIDALESDKYEQGEECLRLNETHFCCLGVLLDIIDPNGWSKNYSHHKDGVRMTYDNRDVLISDKKREEIGIPFEMMTHLASMNDEGNSFEQIADYIEENL